MHSIVGMHGICDYYEVLSVATQQGRGEEKGSGEGERSEGERKVEKYRLGSSWYILFVVQPLPA